jgi:peptide subunit release factor 1 (eRF1)
MNIPEWQSKMIRSSPKSIMKHANKELELLMGGNGSFKDELKMGAVKALLVNDDKKARKCNIDLLTGKRKYTKKHLKLEGVLSNSESTEAFLFVNY